MKRDMHTVLTVNSVLGSSLTKDRADSLRNGREIFTEKDASFIYCQKFNRLNTKVVN